MKSFFNFLKEARTSNASDQAERRGLTGDGHGNWYDKNGRLAAKTKGGRLELTHAGGHQRTQVDHGAFVAYRHATAHGKLCLAIRMGAIVRHGTPPPPPRE